MKKNKECKNLPKMQFYNRKLIKKQNNYFKNKCLKVFKESNKTMIKWFKKENKTKFNL